MAGLRRSPETQSFDSSFEQSGRQPLREHIPFVECKLLVHDPTVVRGKCLANDANRKPFGSRKMSQAAEYRDLTAEMH